MTRGDPDFPGPFGGNPPSYKALRTGTGTYVEYANGDTEYYNLRKDPYELSNAANDPLAGRAREAARQAGGDLGMQRPGELLDCSRRAIASRSWRF